MAADYTRWPIGRRGRLRQIIFLPQFFGAWPLHFPVAASGRPSNSTVGGGFRPNQEAQMNTCTTRAPRPNRLPIVDLIAMVTLAIGVGLATGVVLGGTVLLFSGNDATTPITVVTPVTAVPSR
jgi:hypothetical protein